MVFLTILSLDPGRLSLRTPESEWEIHWSLNSFVGPERNKDWETDVSVPISVTGQKHLSTDDTYNEPVNYNRWTTRIGLFVSVGSLRIFSPVYLLSVKVESLGLFPSPILTFLSGTGKEWIQRILFQKNCLTTPPLLHSEFNLIFEFKTDPYHRVWNIRIV